MFVGLGQLIHRTWIWVFSNFFPKAKILTLLLFSTYMDYNQWSFTRILDAKDSISISSSIGTTLCINATTNKPSFDKPFGHYVRVFVDLEITSDRRDKVLVERNKFAFFVNLEYEDVLDYNSFCKCIGNHFDICKKKRPHLDKVQCQIDNKENWRREQDKNLNRHMFK